MNQFEQKRETEPAECDHTVHHADEQRHLLGSWEIRHKGERKYVACSRSDQFYGYIRSDDGKEDS